MFWSDLTSKAVRHCNYQGTDCGVITTSQHMQPSGVLTWTCRALNFWDLWIFSTSLTCRSSPFHKQAVLDKWRSRLVESPRHPFQVHRGEVKVVFSCFSPVFYLHFTELMKFFCRAFALPVGAHSLQFSHPSLQVMFKFSLLVELKFSFKLFHPWLHS